ncbi:MAG: Rieske (2Fe-2S) protein [Bdellovibrio bacteriovorus]
MTAFPICRLDELPDPGSRAFEVATPEGAVECLLVRRGAQVYAYRNRCPHTGAPLDWLPGQFLDLSGELIQCALHGALFLPETGECVHGPCVGAYLIPVPVTLSEGWALTPLALGPSDSPLD